ncbi:MAG: hypothetical protein FWF33_04705 [Clostridiales bacterium]|nr:hypothetical protein [Clostridiales bacterium]
MEEHEGASLYLAEGEMPYRLWVGICSVGNDIQITVGGGERDHIGAVALAEPSVTVHPVTGEAVSLAAGETSGFSRIQLLSAAGHKDAAIAQMFAGAFCGTFQVNVAVVAGVHVDHATDEEIDILMGNASALLHSAIDAWKMK